MLVYALIIGLFVVGTALAWAIVYGGSRHREVEDAFDHELALSAEGARRREASERAARIAGGVSQVPARESGPRDPSVGVDQARAEVRERIHRYNQREVN